MKRLDVDAIELGLRVCLRQAEPNPYLLYEYSCQLLAYIRALEAQQPAARSEEVGSPAAQAVGSSLSQDGTHSGRAAQPLEAQQPAARSDGLESPTAQTVGLPTSQDPALSGRAAQPLDTETAALIERLKAFTTSPSDLFGQTIDHLRRLARERDSAKLQLSELQRWTDNATTRFEQIDADNAALREQVELLTRELADRESFLHQAVGMSRSDGWGLVIRFTGDPALPFVMEPAHRSSTREYALQTEADNAALRAQVARLLLVHRYADELTVAIDRVEADIGGSRRIDAILRDLGPAVDAARSAAQPEGE